MSKNVKDDEYEDIWEPEYNDKIVVSDCPYCNGIQTLEGKDVYIRCSSCGAVFDKTIVSLLMYGEITKEEALRDAGYFV